MNLAGDAGGHRRGRSAIIGIAVTFGLVFAVLTPLTVANAAGSTPTITTVQVSPTSSTYGLPVTYSATVTSSGTPTGTVAFNVGSVFLCAASLKAGSASCTSVAAPAG